MPVNPVVGVNVISPVELLNVTVPFLDPSPLIVSTVEAVKVDPGSIALSFNKVFNVTAVFIAV